MKSSRSPHCAGISPVQRKPIASVIECVEVKEWKRTSVGVLSGGRRDSKEPGEGLFDHGSRNTHHPHVPFGTTLGSTEEEQSTFTIAAFIWDPRVTCQARVNTHRLNSNPKG